MASNDHDVSEACWADEIFPMSSLQLLAEIRKACSFLLSSKIACMSRRHQKQRLFRDTAMHLTNTENLESKPLCLANGVKDRVQCRQ